MDMDMEQELQELLKDDNAKHMFEETIIGARNIELLYKHSFSNMDYPEDVKEICMHRAIAFEVARYALEDIVGKHQTPPYYFNYDVSTLRKSMYHVDKAYIEWLNTAHTHVPQDDIDDALNHMQLFFNLVQYSLLRGMECRAKLDSTLDSAKNKESSDE